MTFDQIEDARIRLGWSQRTLALRAGTKPDVYYRAARGKVVPRARTLRRWAMALALPEPSARAVPDMTQALILATFRGFAAHFAALHGLDAATALASDPGLRANASASWRDAARVRELAVYCTVTELNLSGSKVAAAIGLTKQAVSLMLRRVEDLRDQPVWDAQIAAAAALISGRK